MADGLGRTAVRGLAALLVLALVAVAAAYFMLRARPVPAPSESAEAVGTVSGPGADSLRTYDSTRFRFRMRYPADWRLSENGEGSAPEGDYLTLTLVPKRAPGSSGGGPSKTLTPLVIEVVPDPQSFDAASVARMKWGNMPANTTAETRTVDISGTDGVEVHIRTANVGGQDLQHRFETIAVVGKRMFLAHFESSDETEYEAMARASRAVMTSLETY